MSTEILNVVVFGESGGGKSSVINMLDGDPSLTTHDGAESIVFTHAARMKIISGRTYRVIDTVGLNHTAGKQRRNMAKDVRQQLTQIIKSLDTGLNLLVYVMRAPEILSTAQKNYCIFFEDVCRKQVPIVIIVTCLENRDRDMDEWWPENESAFGEKKMVFQDHACITATKGKRDCRQDLYEISKRKVEQLLSSSCGEAWMVEAEEPRATNIIRRVLGFA
jgi:predicted GTPase